MASKQPKEKKRRTPGSSQPPNPGSRAHAAPTSSTQRRQAGDPPDLVPVSGVAPTSYSNPFGPPGVRLSNQSLSSLYDNLPPNPHGQRPGRPPPSPYDSSQNRPRPPPPGHLNFPPPPPPPPPSSAPLRRRGQDEGLLGPAHGVAQHHPLPSRGGSAFNPSAHGIGAVSRTLGEVSLAAPVVERYSAFDSRATARTPRPGDSNYVEPLRYDDPDPSERSQPKPSRQPRHGTGSSQPSTRPGKAKGTASSAPLSNLLATADPHPSRRGTARKPPSPPEKPEKAKRRKGTTKKVVYSLQEQEAPEKTVKDTPQKLKWEPEEDQALKEAWEECHEEGKHANWDKIWETMKGKGYGHSRYPNALKVHWSRISPKTMVDWSPEEEQKLKELMSRGLNWNQITESMIAAGYDRSLSSFYHHGRVMSGLE